MSPRIFCSGVLHRHNANALWVSPFFCQTMSIYTHTKSFVASTIVLVCASVLAETPEALVKQALQRNPELNFFVAEIAAAKGAVRTARNRSQPRVKQRSWLQELAGQFRRSERRWRDPGSLIQPNLRVSRSNCATQSDCKSRCRACRTSSATVSSHIGRASADAGVWHFERATKVSRSA